MVKGTLPQTRATRSIKVASVADIPLAAFDDIHEKFPYLRKGEIPNKSGCTMVGKITPQADWHPTAVAIIARHAGQSTQVSV